MRKWAFGVVAVALAAMSGQGVALADSSAAVLHIEPELGVFIRFRVVVRPRGRIR